MNRTLSINKRTIIVLFMFVIALSASLFIGKSPLIGSVAILGLLGGILLVTNQWFGIASVIATLVIGQLVRIPLFGGEGAILPNDVLIPVVIVGWLLRSFLRRRLTFVTSPLSWPFALMTTLLLVTFVLGSSAVTFLSAHEQLSGFFYIVRWLEYVLLFFCIADTVRGERDGRRVVDWLCIAAVLLTILGFLQLRLFPDFRFMVPMGWDPHLGRLLSTWFDPNFLAGFFSFVLCLVGGAMVFSGFRQRITLAVAGAILLAAAILTYSRSGYVALIAGLSVLTFLSSRRIFLLLAIVLVCFGMTNARIQERVMGAFSIDETAKLRIVSWENAFRVYQDFPLTGIGYNTYRYVQVTYGFQKDAAEHSAGGSDSSLLTILVTTGPAGLAAYLWILWASLSFSWSSYRHGASRYIRGLGLGTFSGMVSVIAHSFFINSLLYPHMMATMVIPLGVLAALHAQKKSDTVTP
jgi:O-antigen ligase